MIDAMDGELMSDDSPGAPGAVRGFGFTPTLPTSHCPKRHHHLFFAKVIQSQANKHTTQKHAPMMIEATDGDLVSEDTPGTAGAVPGDGGGGLAPTLTHVMSRTTISFGNTIQSY